MLAEVRNQADTAIYTAGKPLQEHGSRMTDAGRRKPVKEALNALRAAVGSKDVERIRPRIDTLSQAPTSQAPTRFGEAIHSAAATTGTRSAAEQSVASNAGAAGPSVAGATVSSTPSSRK
jgi:molecular chaperone DnaK